MRLTNLEDILREDTCGSERDQAVASLQDEQARLRKLLARPNTPDDYCVLTNGLDACEAAVAVILTLWQRYHSA
ncbi:EscE/YscE/SsaE family type III secretion system needle protein co-chaperone [Pseudomonas chlororaphis]|uniref:EscE/YscE/SsaE family type III secretion system needle protein co-chaperone n=1 Tax=Pseudomonas chlororaphis TaxID=587753 RepID=UPI0015DED9EA|nr:EscE/YscE/SsaE family type III secretion system needle protein co-chaperone [Pseudomonas chlororaphis]QLL13468.1 EscE/YscE/SsaE family type III secretion system needle protein co-chaperone [Pseudomonas chlororaphis subsp. aurantiaca]